VAKNVIASKARREGGKRAVNDKYNVLRGRRGVTDVVSGAGYGCDVCCFRARTHAFILGRRARGSAYLGGAMIWPSDRCGAEPYWGSPRCHLSSRVKTCRVNLNLRPAAGRAGNPERMRGEGVQGKHLARSKRINMQSNKFGFLQVFADHHVSYTCEYARSRCNIRDRRCEAVKFSWIR